MRRENSTDWKHWLRYAEDDKERGEYLKGFAGEGAGKAIAQAAHQLVEHSLKTLYIYKTGELPQKIHDLPELARLCASYGLPISEDERVFLDALHGLFIPLRYPQPAAALPTKEEALQLFGKASALLHKIRDLLPLSGRH